ncbi:MacB-like periplasmic core domain containing protein [Burkholderiaceae bacterium]|jgi:putative ABC transport system permease protein
MSLWWSLAWRSAWSRRHALAMVALSVSVSVLILLGVQQLRHDARQSFTQALSGVDLIVGPRGSASELMLYSVFQVGRPSRNMAHEAYVALRALPQVRWAVPVQLGDTYRGFPVLGTTPELFEVFQTQGARLQWAQGRPFADPQADAGAVVEAVLGAQVAARHGLSVGDRLVLTHGRSDGLAPDHADQPFTVVGVLQATGAPIDRNVIISLQGFEALHQGMGAPGLPWLGGVGAAPTVAERAALVPRELTAVWVGLHARTEVFSARRGIERLPQDSLMAVLPGVALDELWQVVKLAENALLAIGVLVAVSGMLSVAAVLMVGLSARRKELAVLRALGATPLALLGLVWLEALGVCLLGMLGGLLLHGLGLWALQDLLRTELGIAVQWGWPTAEVAWSLAGLVLAAWLAASVPALRAYRLSLVDGLHPPTV